MREPKQLHLNIPPLTDIDYDALALEARTLEELQAEARSGGGVKVLMKQARGLPFRLRRARIQVTNVWQRASRGWADPDWWDLDNHLCQHLGHLLLASAEHGRSYPETHAFEDWQAELRANGQALLDYDGTDA